MNKNWIINAGCRNYRMLCGKKSNLLQVEMPGYELKDFWYEHAKWIGVLTIYASRDDKFYGKLNEELRIFMGFNACELTDMTYDRGILSLKFKKCS